MPPTKPPPDPMEFSNEVADWMKKAHDEVTALLEKVGTPSLGIDANSANLLTKIQRTLAQGLSDHGN